MIDDAMAWRHRCKAKYIVIQCEGSKCPVCKRPLRLLQPKEYEDGLPGFYLCQCGRVAQVGVGPVETDQPTTEEKLWGAFHRLWGKDQETPTYNKQKWTELEGLILQAMKERSDGRAAGDV
jgi:hypothetical protein